MSSSTSRPIRKKGSITVSYRGTFAFGREGLTDVKFRKIHRILVCGKVSLCREVFGNTLNESRDSDRGDSDRYSARFYLSHNYLEQAFDMLIESGFKLAGGCGSGTNSIPTEMVGSPQHHMRSLTTVAGSDSEEGRWYHYNEFVWVREK